MLCAPSSLLRIDGGTDEPWGTNAPAYRGGLQILASRRVDKRCWIAFRRRVRLGCCALTKHPPTEAGRYHARTSITKNHHSAWLTPITPGPWLVPRPLCVLHQPVFPLCNPDPVCSCQYSVPYPLDDIPPGLRAGPCAVTTRRSVFHFCLPDVVHLFRRVPGQSLFLLQTGIA